METDELAGILHGCGINAYNGPTSQSAYEWNMYRENLAKYILNMCEVTKHSDGKGAADNEKEVQRIRKLLESWGKPVK